MLRWILAACAVLGIGFKATYGPLEDAGKRLVEEAGLFLPVDVDPPVTWSACGDWNGFYYFSGRIELCNENLEQGLGVARFIYLHELGHAYTISREIGFERWEGNYEAAADDFAAIMSVVQGHPEDLVYMAKVYEEMGDLWWEEGDPHPKPSERAKHLRDIYLGYLVPWREEFKTYQASLYYWRYQFLEHP